MASPAGPAGPVPRAERPAPRLVLARLASVAVAIVSPVVGSTVVGSTVVGSTVVASAAIAWLGAWLGAWWVPFLIGVAAGLVRKARSRRTWPRRGTVTLAVAGAICGWLLPVWVLALRGQPAGATARAIAGLAGLPPYAGVTIAVLALLAALQVWVGAWLARAASPWRGVHQGSREAEAAEKPKQT